MEKCPSYFEFYEPKDLVQTPFILMVCRNPHTHPPPPRTKTPLAFERTFNSLLNILDWRLADATVRNISTDSTFMHGLRRCLNWTDVRDPELGDLHPSFVNRDHTARLINKMREKYFPKGTGMDGMIMNKLTLISGT